MARRRRSHKIRFPLTVRQAQKLASNNKVSIASLMDAIGLDPDSNRARLQAELARMAAKDPSALIYQSSDEGDNAQPHFSLEENGQGGGDPLDLPAEREGSDRGASGTGNQDRSETGGVSMLEDGKSQTPTSEGQGEDGKSQSSDRQLGESPSTAMGDSDRPDGISGFLMGDQPRDAGAQEPANSQDQESDPVPQSQEGGNQGSDDRPAHQKKWGKKFSKAETSKVSARANNSHGGVTAKLHKFSVNTKLVKLCRQRLSLLVGDSTSEYSHRRDYAEFCIRLKTYRNPSSARKEEEGRPAILIMADVSDSCSSFSRQSVAVAKAASQLGVPGADVLVLTHSNGNPEELEHNGKPVSIVTSETIGLDVELSWNGKVFFYKRLIQRFNISVVVALGDWDAVDCYLLIVSQPIVERLIWLDRGCSSQVRDRTKSALARIISYGYDISQNISQIRHKLTYRDGCRDAVTFVKNIK